MAKRGALDAFFKPPVSANKRPRHEDSNGSADVDQRSPQDVASNQPTASSNTTPSPCVKSHAKPSDHPRYPFPIAPLPSHLSTAVRAPNAPSASPRTLNHLADLDCLYYEPFLARQEANALFRFLRANLFFYRVSYQIKRPPVGDMTINTPRFTTVFGVDASSYFAAPTSEITPNTATANADEPIDDGTSTLRLHSIATHTPLSHAKDAKATYKHPPRPLPRCLDQLRLATEAATGARFNICLVNYYASGRDSISFHSDDERFLGPAPAIASFSLGGRRDFVLKHKPPAAPSAAAVVKDDGDKETQTQTQTQPQLKLPLASGDMILMRGPTQANWLHSIPKRGGKRQDEIEGRINITFRRALVKGGTENYYTYNVGDGEVFRWDEDGREMVPWKKKK
ncbi:MAG: hypothetical protein M1828_001196 [Chrysothrix sp. TS-e1954]|nr:MAG: hypothetical protein M1828_001196 [Chrysothrix sp. TS-e1954]